MERSQTCVRLTRTRSESTRGLRKCAWAAPIRSPPSCPPRWAGSARDRLSRAKMLTMRNMSRSRTQCCVVVRRRRASAGSALGRRGPRAAGGQSEQHDTKPTQQSVGNQIAHTSRVAVAPIPTQGVARSDFGHEVLAHGAFLAAGAMTPGGPLLRFSCTGASCRRRQMLGAPLFRARTLLDIQGDQFEQPEEDRDSENPVACIPVRAPRWWSPMPRIRRIGQWWSLRPASN